MDCAPSTILDAGLVLAGMVVGGSLMALVIAAFHWRRQVRDRG